MELLVITAYLSVVTCLVLAIWLYRENRKAPAAVFVVTGFMLLVMATVRLQQNVTHATNDRAATKEIEARDGVQVVDVSTEQLSIRFERDGEVCEGQILKHNGRYLLAKDPTCATLPA